MDQSYRLGIDVGGTFTDFALTDLQGHLSEVKTLSSPQEPGEAMSKGLADLAQGLGISVQDLLGHCSLFIHGTTVAINALIQHKGAKTGLLCTEGFRDSLEIRLGYRDARFRYDFGKAPPPQLVPRHLRMAVRERIDKEGKVRIPLVEEDVYRAVEILKGESVEAVAVCLLWSFYNPVHEQRIAEILRSELPGVFLSVSADLAPQIGEYERTSTVVLNAYVGPTLLNYLRKTEALLRSLGYNGEIRYIQSNGGIAAPDVIASRPVLCLNSGPAAAPAAGLFYGRQLGKNNLITMDLGGTSFDARLIENGHPRIREVTDVHGYALRAPMIDINTIGAGGGSIAWLDHGLLRVGPNSAGAFPGPACYMRGGQEPTVTDADVVLGYLNPKSLLGGRFPIRAEAAADSIRERIARPLEMTVEEASRGIFEVVNRGMAHALSEVSLERGYDPRDFVAVAAGGQGAVHAGAIVRDLNIRTIIVPKNASTFCAFGSLVTSIRHDYRRSHAARLDALDPIALERDFRKMEQKGYVELALEGEPQEAITVTRQLAMRYADQVYEVSVDVSGLGLTPDCAAELRERLDRQHEKEYTYRHTRGEGEIVHASVTMIGRVPSIDMPSIEPGDTDASQALSGTRSVFFPEGGWNRTEIFHGASLRPGNVIRGPAIVEEDYTTVVVFPGWVLELTPFQCYQMYWDENTSGDV